MHENTGEYPLVAGNPIQELLLFHQWRFLERERSVDKNRRGPPSGSVRTTTELRPNKNGPPLGEPFRELGYKDSNLDSRNQKPKSCHWTIPQSRRKIYGMKPPLSRLLAIPRSPIQKNKLAIENHLHLSENYWILFSR